MITLNNGKEIEHGFTSQGKFWMMGQYHNGEFIPQKESPWVQLDINTSDVKSAESYEDYLKRRWGLTEIPNIG